MDWTVVYVGVRALAVYVMRPQFTFVFVLPMTSLGRDVVHVGWLRPPTPGVACALIGLPPAVVSVGEKARGLPVWPGIESPSGVSSMTGSGGPGSGPYTTSFWGASP